MDIGFDKKIMMENIDFLIRERDMKIGELEKKAGVSLGYISRISKDEKSKPGIDFIIKVAHELNVSIDSLLNYNFSSLSPTEIFLIPFIDKLVEDTRNGMLDWIRERDDELNYMPEIFTKHPLFEDCYGGFRFISKKFEKKTSIAGSCYHINLENKMPLYLMKVCEVEEKGKEPSSPVIEIWMIKEFGEKKYVCSTADSEYMKSRIDELYAAIGKYIIRPKLDEEVRAVIYEYVNIPF